MFGHAIHQRIPLLPLLVVMGLFLLAVACDVEASDTDSTSDAYVVASDREERPEVGISTPFPTRTPQSSGATRLIVPDASTSVPAPTQPRTASPTPAPVPTSSFNNPPVTPTSTSAVTACGSGPVLTHSPMTDGTFRHITPLGNVAPPAHTFPTGHMYFSLPFEETGQNDGPFGDGMVFPAQEVYAAADARIASLALADVVSTMAGDAQSYQEFDLHLEVCDGIWIKYGHIGPLSDRLQALVDESEPNWCNSYSTGSIAVERCEYSPDWTVEAGELIAFTSGRAAAFDFGASRLEGSNGWTRVSECPLDLYGEQQRIGFEELLGTSQLQHTAAPLCGTVYQDIPGTAQGRWFTTLEEHGPEDQNIALVHDNVDPAVPVFSIGTSLPGVQSNVYRFAPAATGNVNREFASVTPGSGVVCYEGLADRWGSGLGQTLLVEMQDETTLRVEAVHQESCDAGSWSLSAGAVSYLR